MDDPGTNKPDEANSAGHDELTGEDLDALIAGAAGKDGEQGMASPDGPASTADGQPWELSTPGPAHHPGSPAVGGEASHPGGSFDLPDFGAAGAPAVDARRITMLNDVKLNVKIELGRTRMLVEEVLKLNEGSVVELNKPAGDPVEVFVNERLVARGEVLVLNDNFCVRISEVLAADPHRVSV